MFGGNRPFGDHYWPEGPERLVDTLEVLGSKWELREQVYCSGGCFPRHNFLTTAYEVTDSFPIRWVVFSMLLSYGDSKFRLEEVQKTTVREELRRLICKKYYAGVLSTEGK